VTALPLAPLIPLSSVPADRRRAWAAAGRPLPLARPMRSVPQDVVYGVARIDASGRICERAIIATLGWAGGDRLTSTAEAGVVTARRDPGGMVTLPASGYITIPAALRRRCGLKEGRTSTTPAVSPASSPERASTSPGGLCAAEGSKARTRRLTPWRSGSDPRWPSTQPGVHKAARAVCQRGRVCGISDSSRLHDLASRAFEHPGFNELPGPGKLRRRRATGDKDQAPKRADGQSWAKLREWLSRRTA